MVLGDHAKAVSIKCKGSSLGFLAFGLATILRCLDVGNETRIINRENYGVSLAQIRYQNPFILGYIIPIINLA